MGAIDDMTMASGGLTFKFRGLRRPYRAAPLQRRVSPLRPWREETPRAALGKGITFNTFEVELYLGERTSGSSGQDAFEYWRYGTWLSMCPYWIVATERAFKGVIPPPQGDGPVRAPIKGRVTFVERVIGQPDSNDMAKVLADYADPNTVKTLRSYCEKLPVTAETMGIRRE